ncbi:hypothetical protein WOA01_01950 [Methylocystis sp. IM2]|uniref:hypothetical protein n=1 Tax=unclassified Methylocystis TaxID=2625913 RepID=UPI0030FB35AF
MNADASALMVLTVLALGTFTAGLNGVWRMCLIGAPLALGVPLIAWIDEATLLYIILLLAVALIVYPTMLLVNRTRTAKKSGLTGSRRAVRRPSSKMDAASLGCPLPRFSS